MLASKQLFWDKYGIPNNVPIMKTSELIEACCLCYFVEPSAPIYLPIGQIIIDKINLQIDNIAYDHGVNKITIPILVKNETLKFGEPIKDSFCKQIMSLKKPLNDFHILFTPEPIIIQLAKQNLLSYRQLPIRICLTSDVFRIINDTKGILKSREFLTFMGLSIDPNNIVQDESIAIFSSMTSRIFSLLHVNTRKCNRATGINEEFYYIGTEGEYISLPEVDTTQKTICLSLAMTYKYCPNSQISVRFRNESNLKQPILITTYGLGLQRLFYAILDSCRDDFGFNIPEILRPFKISIIPKKRADFKTSFEIYHSLQKHIGKCFFDDRFQHSSGKRSAFSDNIGIPKKIIVNDNTLTVNERGIGRILNEFDFKDLNSLISSIN